VVVFWCRHAEASEEVENEITAAITQKKDILPLLLDETPLPSRLAEFQYIDFRTAFGRGHAVELTPVPTAPGPESARSKTVKVFWAAGLLVGVITIAVTVLGSRILTKVYEVPPTEGVWLSPPANLWLFALFIGVVLFVLWRRRRARKRQTADDRAPGAAPVSAFPMPYARLAQTIEAELLRRAQAWDEEFGLSDA